MITAFLVIALFDLCKDFLVVDAIKGRDSCQQDEEDYTDTPDITFLVILSSFSNNFWRYVVNCSEQP